MCKFIDRNASAVHHILKLCEGSSHNLCVSFTLTGNINHAGLITFQNRGVLILSRGLLKSKKIV